MSEPTASGTGARAPRTPEIFALFASLRLCVKKQFAAAEIALLLAEQLL
jgi:hypothetical protein